MNSHQPRVQRGDRELRGLCAEITLRQSLERYPWGRQALAVLGQLNEIPPRSYLKEASSINGRLWSCNRLAAVCALDEQAARTLA